MKDFEMSDNGIQDTTPSPAVDLDHFLHPDYEELDTQEFVPYNEEDTQPFNFGLHRQAVLDDGLLLPDNWYEISYQENRFILWNIAFQEGIHKLIEPDLAFETFVNLVVEVSGFWEIDDAALIKVLECDRWEIEAWLDFEPLTFDQAAKVKMLREYGLYLVMSDQPLVVPRKYCPVCPKG